jgi:hypothetical protein
VEEPKPVPPKTEQQKLQPIKVENQPNKEPINEKNDK